MIAAVLGITGAVALGAISPGPSFVMVARTAVAGSRTESVATALGIGVGGVGFATAALFGLHVVLNSVPGVNLGLRLLGGAYLVCLGGLMWGRARRPLHLPEPGTEVCERTFSRAFGLGLLTQASNPKAAVIYASIFASLLPREVPPLVNVLLPLLIFIVEAGWYSIVALTLSTPSPRALYVRSKVWIDRIAGGVMILIGARLIAAVGQA
jgi:threonine/homoserine/homoserine lactone efflux protein